MTSYIVTGRTEDGSVWATGSVTLNEKNKSNVSWGDTKEQAYPYSKVVAESIIQDAPKFVYKLEMVEIEDTNNISKCGLDPHNLGRMHSKNFVMVDLPSYVKIGLHTKETIQYPFQVVHDTGRKIWIAATYSDEWPEEVLPVGDGSNKGYDTQGNCLVSVPVSWCTFYTHEDADNIAKCIDADHKLIGYM